MSHAPRQVAATSAGVAGRADAAAAATAPPRPRRRIDARWYSSTLLTAILVIGQWKFQILGDSYVPWMVALGTAVATELVLSKLLRHEWPNILSAYISGNSVAILLKPDSSELWPFAVASALSIASKYVLVFKGRHIWNPTNFGICVMLLAASERVSLLSHQWGNEPVMVAIIWAIGLLTVWRAKVIQITLAYLVSFVLFAWLRTFVNGHGLLTELGPITGPMYQLYMFFMITDPRTIVVSKKMQVVVTVIIALVECWIRLGCDFDTLASDGALCAAPPMFALFLVGPLAKAIDLAPRGPTAAPRPAAK